MKDKLERFVNEHRRELDQHDPKEQIWKAIETRLSKKNILPAMKKQKGTYNLSSVWKIAAALALLISAAIVFIRHEKSTMPESTQAITREYSSIDAQYVALIEVKRGELKKLEKDNPGFRNVRKRLYEEKGILCGEISFTFDSLSHVRFFKFDKDSPYMYYASNPLSSETLVETNGSQGEQWMPMVFWKKDARDFFVKTHVVSEARYRTSLLRQFREWQAQQKKK